MAVRCFVMGSAGIIRAGEAVQDGLLPVAELGLELFGDGGLLLDEIGLLGGIGLEVEEFALWRCRSSARG